MKETTPTIEPSFIPMFQSIIGQNPSVSKSHHLHVVIFWFAFMNLRYNP